VRRAHRHVLVLTAQLALAAWAGRVARVAIARIVTGVRQGVPCLPIAPAIVVTGGDGREPLGPSLMAESEVLRHVMPLKCVLRRHRRWSERLSAITTSDNDGGGYGETGDPLTDPRHYPGYGYPGYPASPGSQSELSSEDKYVAMSPPHLLHQTYQQFSTTSQSTTSRTTEPTSSSLQASDQTVEYPAYPRHFS
jgi:hypothetical protein